MDVAKRRQRAEVEQLAYDLKILRAERDVLLQEMERKDEQARFITIREYYFVYMLYEDKSTNTDT
jgi:hypothetical protein